MYNLFKDEDTGFQRSPKSKFLDTDEIDMMAKNLDIVSVVNVLTQNE
ncbi:hypothetical protein [Sulfuricurvum sp.]